MKKAFTMMELIFVITIIGILAAIAVPKFAATRSDAEVTKAKATIASVKAALSTERQLRILRGNFNSIDSLNADASGAFSTFGDGSGGDTGRFVLESTVPGCNGGSDTACWTATGTATGTTYTYTMPSGVGGSVAFTLSGGQFTCSMSDSKCYMLSK